MAVSARCQARIRGVAVALSPVFGVPVGSISRMWTSPRATGRCSTPLGPQTLRRPEGNRAIPQLDVERSFEDKEKIVCLVMFVPVERPFKFGHHDVVIIVSGDSAGREAIGERSELFGENGWRFHHFSVHLLRYERGRGHQVPSPRR